MAVSLPRINKYYMRFSEIANPSIKPPLNPDQQRIKSMKDRIKRDQEAVKAERARQQIQKARQSLVKIL